MLGNAILQWGPNENDLEDMPNSGGLFALDKIFNVVYIDSSVQLEKVFKRYTRNILKEKNISENEKSNLNISINNLNTCISELKNIKKWNPI